MSKLAKSRELPRHIDGRVKILGVPWIKFLFLFLPGALLIGFTLLPLAFKLNAPPIALIAFFIGGIWFVCFYEIYFGLSGFDIIVNYIKAQRKGHIYYYRSMGVQDEKNVE